MQWLVALHGAVRGTVDIDFVLEWNKETLLFVEKILLEAGLVSMLPINANEVFTNREKYIKERNLIAWNFYNPKDLSQQIDIIITYDLMEGSIKKIPVGDQLIKVLNKKALIKMKKESGREQDLQDVAALERLDK